jgi:hypothetical protein
MQRKDHSFEVFKGLQKPLVFHSFKGKFIYWGAGFAVMSLVNAVPSKTRYFHKKTI